MDQEFGVYLKQIREEKGWSISRLAQAAEISGSQISRIENGLRGVPKPQTLRKIADALDVPYEELMSQAGYLETEAVPAAELSVPVWATAKDKRDFKKCWRMTES